MSRTIIGIILAIVAILRTALPKVGWLPEPGEVEALVTHVVGLGGALWAWRGRVKARGPVNAMGLRSVAVLAVCLGLLAGCATTQTDQQAQEDIQDRGVQQGADQGAKLEQHGWKSTTRDGPGPKSRVKQLMVALDPSGTPHVLTWTDKEGNIHPAEAEYEGTGDLILNYGDFKGAGDQHNGTQSTADQKRGSTGGGGGSPSATSTADVRTTVEAVLQYLASPSGQEFIRKAAGNAGGASGEATDGP